MLEQCGLRTMIMSQGAQQQQQKLGSPRNHRANQATRKARTSVDGVRKKRRASKKGKAQAWSRRFRFQFRPLLGSDFKDTK